MRRPSFFHFLLIFLLFSEILGYNVSDSESEEEELGEDYYDEDSAEFDENEELEEEFEGASHWEQHHRELCDNKELDDTWRWAEALCFTYFYDFRVIKMEVLAWSPALVIYRDFFSKQEVEEYVDFLQDMYYEEQLVVDDDGQDYFSKVRKANGTYFSAYEYPETQKLFNIIKTKIPNINWDVSEDITALSYNPGGHYAVHYDYLFYKTEKDWDSWMRNYGNRMATFIGVFKKADAGGDTVFPALRATVRPNVGDAFLWFNMKGDGSQEDLSEHGGCPIYEGNKMISTIWIRMANQPIMESVTEPGSLSAELLIPGMI